MENLRPRNYQSCVSHAERDDGTVELRNNAWGFSRGKLASSNDSAGRGDVVAVVL